MGGHVTCPNNGLMRRDGRTDGRIGEDTVIEELFPEKETIFIFTDLDGDDRCLALNGIESHTVEAVLHLPRIVP